MNLSYILPVYWPAIGGCEVHTRELVKRIAKDHKVKVITLINSQEEKLAYHSLWEATTIYASGINEVYIDESAEIYKLSLSKLWRMALYPFIRSKMIYRNMEAFSVFFLTNVFQYKMNNALSDSFLIHSVFGGLSYLSYTALKISKKKKISFVFTPLLHLFDESWKRKLIYCKKLGKEFEYKPDLYIEPMGYHDKYWLKTCQEADALITMTEYEREFFISILKIGQEKVHNIGVGPVVSKNPVPERIKKKYKISDNQAIVLFLGRNHELKGIEELCMAAKLVWDTYPDTLFFFVGPKEGKSKSILEKYRDKRIIEVDEVGIEEKSDFLAACDIFCMPSLHESFGGVFLEAWMFEKPIIGADIPPVRELTEDGKGGFLVNAVPIEIAEKIIELVRHKDIAQRMGKWGRQKVLNKYDWGLIANNMAQIYSTLMEQKNGKY